MCERCGGGELEEGGSVRSGRGRIKEGGGGGERGTKRRES